MRVLVISHGHPAFSIGGAEVASHALFRALNATPGVEAFFLSRAAPPMRRHSATPLLSLRQGEREVFLHTDAWDEFLLSNGGLNDLEGAFAAYLAHVRPDVVHFHHVIGLGLEAVAQVRRQLPGARLVITFHEYLPICANHGQMVKTGRGALCHAASPAACNSCFPSRTPAQMFGRERHVKDHLLLADAFVAPSRFLMDRYTAWGLPAERFHVIENGLDGVPVPPRALPEGGRRDRFGFFGQVTEFKGLPVLLDAVGRVPDAVWGDATLNVFGGNLEFQPEAFRTRFAGLMERAGRRARFHGAYRPEDLPRLMGGVDWTVVPSIWWENSPVVIQEAFLHRRPPITSDIGGMAEKVADGLNGLHFRVGSPEDLVDRLTRALTEPGLWDRLAAAAPRPPDLAAFARLHLAAYGAPPAAAAAAAATAPRRQSRRQAA
ncbi:MAG: glycosyltransferase family 4 protein [Janthinobacterium lividum]